MTSLVSIKVGQERARKKKFGQQIASPGNVGNGMEGQRETLEDGQPIINK